MIEGWIEQVSEGISPFNGFLLRGTHDGGGSAPSLTPSGSQTTARKQECKPATASGLAIWKLGIM